MTRCDSNLVRFPRASRCFPLVSDFYLRYESRRDSLPDFSTAIKKSSNNLRTFTLFYSTFFHIFRHHILSKSRAISSSRFTSLNYVWTNILVSSTLIKWWIIYRKYLQRLCMCLDIFYSWINSESTLLGPRDPTTINYPNNKRRTNKDFFVNVLLS